MADELIAASRGMLASLSQTLAIQRRHVHLDILIFDEWEVRLRQMVADVGSLPLRDRGRGEALRNLQRCRDVLAEIRRLAEGAAE